MFIGRIVSCVELGGVGAQLFKTNDVVSWLVKETIQFQIYMQKLPAFAVQKAFTFFSATI